MPAPGAFTRRAVAVGVGLAVAHALLAPLSAYRLFSTEISAGVLPVGVVLLFLMLTLANVAFARLGGSNPLRPGELAVILGMLWVGASAFQVGVLGNTLGIISAPEYFASAENRWAEFYLPHIPPWSVPSNSTGGVRAFYNGLPPGEGIPWAIWFVPLFWWGSLVVALFAVVSSMMTIVHEQWLEHEKLQFPMADVALDLIGDPSRGAAPGSGQFSTPAWMRSKLFWIGAAIPLFVISWNILNWFDATLPFIPLFSKGGDLGTRYFPSIPTRLDPFTVGLAYFTPLAVLRGYWMGFALIGAEMGLGRHFGFANGMNPGFEPWSDWGTQTAAWQCFGSLVLWVLWSLWIGRRHLGLALRSAVTHVPEIGPRQQQRYRVAVWGFVAGLVYIACWFNAAGMAWGIVAMFLPIMVLTTLGIAKMIAMSSFVRVQSPVSAQTLIMQTVGTAYIPQASMTALVLSYVVFRANEGMMMPQVAFASRIGDRYGALRGRLHGGLGLAVLAGLVVVVAVMVVLAYNVGAFNFSSHAFRTGHIEAYNTLLGKKVEALSTDWYRLGFLGGGMALMAAVLLIRARIANFWLHPVGLVAATAVEWWVFNVFIAWLLKATLDRLGGHGLANRARPFFLGLVVGHVLGVGLGMAVDALFFPGIGHRVPIG